MIMVGTSCACTHSHKENTMEDHGHDTVLIDGKLKASDIGSMSICAKMQYHGEYTDITEMTSEELKLWLGY